MKQMETEVGRKVLEAVRPRLEERLDTLVEDILATIRYTVFIGGCEATTGGEAGHSGGRYPGYYQVPCL